MAFFLLAAIPSAAQNTDIGGWLSYSLQHKLTKKWMLEISPELRFNQDFSQLDRVVTDLSVEYKPIKPLEISGGYRLALRNQTYNDRIRHRLFADVKWSQKLHKRVELFYRIRYQNRFSDFNFQTEENRNSNFLRHKIGTDLNLPKKLSARLAVDFWQPVGSEQSQLQNRRYSFLLGWDQTKNHRWQIGILHDKVLNSPFDNEAVIFVLKHRMRI